MTWVRVETRFTSHPKVLDIGPHGEALWLRALCYAGEHLTDGFIPATYVKRMGDMKGLTVAARLVDVGLWENADEGFVIHDYLSWQSSKDEVEAISLKRAHAGRLGGKQKASNVLAKRKQTPSKTLADIDIDIDTEPDIKPEGKKHPSGVKKAQSQLPENWEPNEADIAYAEEKGLYHWQGEAENFRDYWAGNGRTMADWGLTWKRWVRTALERKAVPTNGHRKPKGPDFYEQAIVDMQQGRDYETL